MQILVLEPDKILADNYHQVLSDSGFKVASFFDPQSAVEEMDINIPDIIVMEIQLAPISGLAFLYELRSYEDFSHIPIIIYSHVPKETFNLEQAQWQSLGIVKYFYKPRISIQKVASFARGELI
jgi:DNA-binding response OmpR family regulator